jgi:hypothetical protein
MSGGVDFDALIAQANRDRLCAECGAHMDFRAVLRSAFCSDPCRYRFRDRRRYAENPEEQRERARRYYSDNREAVLARAAAKRALVRPAVRTCEECGGPLSGRQRVVCSRRCKTARFRRLNPAAWAEVQRRKNRKKAERRRARRRGES